jgi:hypothetical protein
MPLKRIIATTALSLAAIGSAQAAEPSFAQIVGGGFTLVTGKTSFSLADFGPEALFKAEYTSGAAAQTFGFFSGAASKQIFAGSATSGATFALSSGAIAPVNADDFGLYFTSGTRYNLGSTDRIQTWYNDSTKVWAFGFEDGSDRDYQDMVVTMAPVPEPSTYALMAAGLLAVGVLSRRRSPRS